MNRSWLTLSIASLLLLSESLAAQPAVMTLRSTVKGNQEQPKVLYVIPWQAAPKTDFDYKPDARLLDSVFEQVDRDEFLREINYRQQIKKSGENAI